MGGAGRRRDSAADALIVDLDDVAVDVLGRAAGDLVAVRAHVVLVEILLQRRHARGLGDLALLGIGGVAYGLILEAVRVDGSEAGPLRRVLMGGASGEAEDRKKKENL